MNNQRVNDNGFLAVLIAFGFFIIGAALVLFAEFVV